MKRIGIFLILAFSLASWMGYTPQAQTVLTIEYQDSVNTETGTWYGWNIPRSTPTTFTFRNNTITSQNTIGYMLQAGDENPASENNNLDGAVITGNKLVWAGDKTASTITHALFTGYNIDVVIKYNYLDVAPMAVVRKSNGMTDTQGVIAYNIIRSPEATGVVVKGMNGVRIYNNTFYSSNTTYTGPGAGTWRGLIDIYMNDNPVASATGTKIKNNVFYTKNQILNIYLYEAACTTDFECDYNVYYCEVGDPKFRIGSTEYTFSQWQALGYDTHSAVVNPSFVDTVNFAPSSRLNYGTNLGSELEVGLAATAVWGNGSPQLAVQDDTWQAGAVVLTNTTYFVAPDGNDTSGDGSYSNPWFTLNRAWSSVAAGNIIYMRGGTYEFLSAQILSGKNGTAQSPIKVMAYPGEHPTLTIGTGFTYPSWPAALVRLTAQYTYWDNMEITGFVQPANGIFSGFCAYNGGYNTFKRMNIHHNGHGMLVYNCQGVLVENCDFHHNYDPIDNAGDPYGDGDGLELGYIGNGYAASTVRGCRFWNNADDGIDLWENASMVTIEDCWSWNNGYQEDGVTEGGDGNGFKLGLLEYPANDNYVTQHLRTVRRNVSFNNRAGGINQNLTYCVIHLYNNTTLNNPYGYIYFNTGTAIQQVRNNISFNNTNNGTFHSNDGLSHNTFLYDGTTNPAYSVTTGDFLSLDTTGVSGARQANGDKPALNFVRLSAGSDLINTGYGVGLPYSGTAPDLGAYEFTQAPASAILKSKTGTAIKSKTGNFLKPHN